MINNIFLLCCVVLCAGEGFEEDCGLESISSQPLVRSGMRVRSREFPWHVAIFYNNGDGDKYEQICGGSIVRSQLVITAAHCFSMKEDNHTVDLSAYRVVGGSLNSTWTTENLEGRQQSEVRAVRLGENYGAHVRHFQDDIAIVHLRTEFIFSPVVRAVCLDLVNWELHNTQTSPGRVGKVAGWGLTESGTASNQLNFLQIPVVGSRQCYRQMRSDYKAHITSDKICAGLTNGSAMCQGDSGGGLVFPLQDAITAPPRWYLRAVLSNAPISYDQNERCLTKYLTMYSNTFSHRRWLSLNMEQLQPQKRCRARGSVGSCKDFNNCPAAIEDAYRGILPLHCSPSSSKICCVGTCAPLPSSIINQRKTGSKAKDYCVDLAERLYPCQQNGSSWSRGDICEPEPEKQTLLYWLARLNSTSEIPLYGFVSDGKLAVFLVSERWLITIEIFWDMYHKFSIPRNIDPPPEVVFSVSRRVVHPDYNPESLPNNIVLIEMDRPVTFRRTYRPVCLHTAQDSVRGPAFSRWDWDGNRVPVSLLSQEQGRRKFPPGSKDPGGVATDSQLFVTSRGNQMRCENTMMPVTASNGHRVACTQLLMGVVYNGQQEGSTCTQRFLRLSPYIPWVESVVWP